MIHSHSELLRPRAWEVKESPNNLRYQGCFRLGEIPADWTRWQVAGVSAGSENHVYLFHRGHDVHPCFASIPMGNCCFPGITSPLVVPT